MDAGDIVKLLDELYAKIDNDEDVRLAMAMSPDAGNNRLFELEKRREEAAGDFTDDEKELLKDPMKLVKVVKMYKERTGVSLFFAKKKADAYRDSLG